MKPKEVCIHKRTRIFQPGAAWLLIAASLFATGFVDATPASAQSVVAVLSSETGPYQEALKGLEQEWGQPIPVFILSKGEPQIPPSARVIIAFGSKAALREYPDGKALIFAMAPGVEIRRRDVVAVNMEPDASTLLEDLRRLQPGLKKLGIFWQSSSFQAYDKLVRQAAQPLGLTIESAAVSNSADVPDYLRAAYGKIDAIWLPPDPLLLNAATLSIFVEFSRADHIPLFVPIRGLVEEGATASIGTDFLAFGRLAGVAARKALANEPQDPQLYSTNVEIVISKTATAQVGLQIPQEALEKVDKILP